jgi:hypothetical protein
MTITNLFRGPIRAPEGEPGAGASGGEPPAPPVAPTPPAGDGDPPPEELRLTSEQLRDRLNRSRTAFLRANGLDSEEAFKQLVERDKQRATQEDEARRASLSREQVLQEDLARERAARVELEERAARFGFERHVAGICATLGVRNLDYATFEIERAAAALPEGQELDVEAWLRESMETRPAMRAAFGLDVATTVSEPITTTTAGGPRPTPPRAGGAPPSSDVFGMDSAAWQSRKDALGIG